MNNRSRIWFLPGFFLRALVAHRPFVKFTGVVPLIAARDYTYTEHSFLTALTDGLDLLSALALPSALALLTALNCHLDLRRSRSRAFEV